MRLFLAVFLACSAITSSLPIPTNLEEPSSNEPSTNEPSTLSLPREPKGRIDAMIDANADGELDVDEVKYAAFVHHGLSSSVVDAMFKQVDANNDGLLNGREFENIRGLVLEKAENAALRYLQNVDTDRDGELSLREAQTYLLREYGIGTRDVERIWLLVTPTVHDHLNATMFSRLRRRVRGMTIRLARQIMKSADSNGDGHISVEEAQAVAFEQEGIGAGDVAQMVMSVDENGDGELNAPEFADFERIVRARAVENSKKAMRVVDSDGSGTVTLEEAKNIAFEHYGFNEETLAPFFAQADEDEDGQLDSVEFAGFRSVIRARSVKDAVQRMKEIDLDGDGLVSLQEAVEATKAEDDMDTQEILALFNIADQNKSGRLDKVELADFNRLVRLSSIKFATDHFKEFDLDRDGAVTFGEISLLIEQKYGISTDVIQSFFNDIDADASGDLTPAEIVDFRHLIRRLVAKKKDEKQNEMTSQEATNITELPTSTTSLAPPPTLLTTSPEMHEDTQKPSTTMTSSTHAPTAPSSSSTTTATTTPSELGEDGIANDVIAQDIVTVKMVPTTKATEKPTTSTTTTTTTTTRRPRTTTTAPTEEEEEVVEEVEEEETTTVAPKRHSKPMKTSTTTTEAPVEKIVEIVYEDADGKRHSAPSKNQGDVSYEEVVEYVDAN
ncbi:unnamed protein product [Caenorhabditis auriculariae]|uniref:EF-hand domain-containing protein n=1 Tax=Caenorhabditis auriculariae TaxID=2777116 RepID=A0A8S1GYU7_9PELO|nr:unnamed protein product [Caenorhabditis auriculariae]